MLHYSSSARVYAHVFIIEGGCPFFRSNSAINNDFKNCHYLVSLINDVKQHFIASTSIKGREMLSLFSKGQSKPLDAPEEVPF